MATIIAFPGKQPTQVAQLPKGPISLMIDVKEVACAAIDVTDKDPERTAQLIECMEKFIKEAATVSNLNLRTVKLFYPPPGGVAR